MQAAPLLKRGLMLVSPLSCSLSTSGNMELLNDGSIRCCAAPLGEALQRSDMTVQRLDSLSSSHFKQNKHLHRCKGIDLAWLFHRAAEFGSRTCQRLSHCRLIADKVFSLNEHIQHKLMSSSSISVQLNFQRSASVLWLQGQAMFYAQSDVGVYAARASHIKTVRSLK